MSNYKPPKNVTKTVGKREYNIDADWIDDSFDHAFGTQHQGFYEVVKVTLDGVELPIDILEDKFLQSLDEYVN